MQIKFKSDMNFSYGVSTNLSNKVRRIIAKNPSNFTLHGTGTYIIGKGDVAIIDPGPDDDEHINSILNELKNENVTHIFVTHTHKDHSSAANKLHNLTKAPLYGFGKHRKKIDNKLPLVEEGADYEFSPNIKVRDNNIFEGETWKLRAIHTPGHTSNHLCYELIEEKTLFSGDHLMGWSTTVISPPDGSMEDYLKSLKKLLDFSFDICWPTHGPSISNIKEFIKLVINHRIKRENQILKSLKSTDKIIDIVKKLYKDKDPALYPAASQSILAHLIYLVDKKIVTSENNPSINSKFTLL
ncbi:MAG: MBL fold metallo-hydrolase [Rhodospirillaceae bacterium]|nr:MBL fold metallo-hydrolase [Rhodospirillaceae bacterium]|tara:strand:- start:1062 stop:1955 length:894 start_codon:yes stop_codon:yes gene_type:complete